jgi:nucleoside-diphosphate-sugar epimerase
MTIAILGSSGFIGGRAVEVLHLSGQDVRPIVRSFSSLARLARFDLDCRLADARDCAALRTAFKGCDIVVHAVTGDEHIIDGTLTPVYRAAQESGVRRLIYLSTASVYGQAPEPGTDETAPLRQNHALTYNNAKVRAERRLLNLRAHGEVELVMLRPGIVFGPRSRWIDQVARQLLNGTAYLVGDGSGICNSIYVDNVVHAIRLALRADPANVDREAFLIGDEEEVTWSEFYGTIADALRVDRKTIHHVEPPVFKRSWTDRIDALRASSTAQSLMPMVPAGIKNAAKAAIQGFSSRPPASSWELPQPPRPVVTQEMALLHQCRWRFPNDKARRCLGYSAIIPFSEGCRRSMQWLGFVGIPVRQQLPAETPQVKPQFVVGQVPDGPT